VNDCPHRPPCPGCPRLGAIGPSERALATLAALASSAGAPPPSVVLGSRSGFRHRARLAVRGRASSPKIGIFREGTHSLVDIPRCCLHHPRINEVAAALRRSIVATRSPPYSDASGLGLVRYLQVVVERSTERAQVVVVTRSASPEPARALFDDLAQRLGDRLHGLFWSGQEDRGNAILGSSVERIAGEAAVVERFGGAQVFYPPAAFGQSHLELAGAVVEHVHARVPGGASVTELYAGVGPIGLGLAARASRLTLNELGAGSLEGLALGVDALPAPLRGRVSIVPGPAASATTTLADADVVIVDPPRRGLDTAVTEALVARPPARLLYVSCGLASLEADLLSLLRDGRLALRELIAFDQFPYTEHVEVLADLVRTPADDS